ncbi:MAG: BMC domain-containing protein, partial [Clostridia bacterium]|nr:BMC domain-containing protein [Clostridia bacterium]
MNITKEDLLERIFHDDYKSLMGKTLRMTRVRVPGKEVCLAHVMTPNDKAVYQNLGLHIGVHEGE